MVPALRLRGCVAERRERVVSVFLSFATPQPYLAKDAYRGANADAKPADLEVRLQRCRPN